MGISPPYQSSREKRVLRCEPGRSCRVCSHRVQVSAPEGSVKIEVRKENLLSNGTAGAGHLEQGSPFPAGGLEMLETPGGRSWLELIPLASRGSLQSGISSALAQSDNPVKGRVATAQVAN